MGEKATKRMELIALIEEDIQVLSESLGNFNRMSIYNQHKSGFVEQTKKDINYMVDLRETVKKKPL